MPLNAHREYIRQGAAYRERNGICSRFIDSIDIVFTLVDFTGKVIAAGTTYISAIKDGPQGLLSFPLGTLTAEQLSDPLVELLPDAKNTSQKLLGLLVPAALPTGLRPSTPTRVTMSLVEETPHANVGYGIRKQSFSVTS